MPQTGTIRAQIAETLGEVENVTTGTSRTLTVDLIAGDSLLPR